MPEISNDEIRYKILQVLYETATRSTDWRVRRDYLLTKLDFDAKKIDFNLLYLDSRKIAQVVSLHGDNWDEARITGEGIDVYEHKLKFVDKYPFIQVAIQNINGSVYGNALQAVDSQVSINQKIIDSFNQARYFIEVEKSVTDEQKIPIKENLETLEKELRTEHPDKSKVSELWDWIKVNASWVVPTLKDVIEEILKTKI